MPMALLLHVPPLTGSVNNVVEPRHTWLRPVMAPGDVFTVTVIVLKQPVGII
jgi:hypothetical protein